MAAAPAVGARRQPHTRIQPTRGLPRLNLGELKNGREILRVLTWRDIKVRYKQSVLGFGWAILQPLLTMIVFAVFLGLLAKVPSTQGVPYAMLIYAGLIP